MRPGPSPPNRDEDQSKPGKHQGFLPPKKAKTVMSAGKVMVCSTTQQKSHKITSQSLSPETRGMLFHKDNTLAHTSTVIMAAFQKCGFKLVEHSPFSLYDILR